jgi:hypothetical protein
MAINASTLPLETMREASGRKTNPPRYKPPATSYWAHSVYRYHKSSTRLLPVISANAATVIHTYFNMLPCGYKYVIEKFNQNPQNLPSLFRAFVSDRAICKRSMKPDLMGKLSPRKSSFWRPFRRLMSLQPQIVFKHYPKETRIMALVYDRRVEVLNQRLDKLSRLMRIRRQKDQL